ncbi:hypothetical protein EDEG_01745 [Edhazardia aedis USNM 41457]|uniref:Uncharacterized protein n=1 Tax=Edhazardia aedis (strain USNM 41457) TaxID=1003232 RepID=J8ZWA6_EDHAE|nr:hypothetical protein EDEG_01745 [Edhazardia aedis USNM 41457]|eukprot:EJW03978.1 hypothetical protein EDEG_01745 [Edhazardia aedis USNM 41457]
MIHSVLLYFSCLLLNATKIKKTPIFYFNENLLTYFTLISRHILFKLVKYHNNHPTKYIYMFFLLIIRKKENFIVIHKKTHSNANNIMLNDFFYNFLAQIILKNIAISGSLKVKCFTFCILIM